VERLGQDDVLELHEVGSEPVKKFVSRNLRVERNKRG
jgi:hypothetical protein